MNFAPFSAVRILLKQEDLDGLICFDFLGKGLEENGQLLLTTNFCERALSAVRDSDSLERMKSGRGTWISTAAVIIDNFKLHVDAYRDILNQVIEKFSCVPVCLQGFVDGLACFD